MNKGIYTKVKLECYNKVVGLERYRTCQFERVDVDIIRKMNVNYLGV